VLPGSVLAIDLIFTSLVVGRLVYYQRNLKKLLGARSSSHYTSISTMIVESASLNIVFQTIALASTFDKIVMNSIFNVNLLGQTQASSIHIVTRYQSTDILAQVFATLLIIFRVAQGKAWAEQTSQEMITQLRFRSSRRSLEDGPTQDAFGTIEDKDSA